MFICMQHIFIRTTEKDAEIEIEVELFLQRYNNMDYPISPLRGSKHYYF